VYQNQAGTTRSGAAVCGYQLLTPDTSHVVQTGVSTWHQLLYPTTVDDAIRLMLSALD